MIKKELINDLRKKGFNSKILKAFNNIDRQYFIPETYWRYAYLDQALPIGYNVTISQPSTIAFMLKLLELDKLERNRKLKILEIGSGSGYVLGLINEICKCKIIGIERIKELVENSSAVLGKNRNIEIIHRDGSKGYKKESPFDRILVSASSDCIIDDLIEQLKDNGILVIPVGNSIFKIKKNFGIIKKEEYPGFLFVPLFKK